MLEELIVRKSEQYRKSIKFSVKKSIEGKGMTFDNEIRKDSHQDAIMEVLVKYRKGEYKIHYNPQLDTIYIKSNKFTGELKPFLCSLARYKYWNYLKKNTKKPIIDLDDNEAIQEQERDTLRTPSAIVMDNMLFSLYLKTSYTQRQQAIIRYVLQGYSYTEIASFYKVSQQAVSKAVKGIGKKLQTY